MKIKMYKHQMVRVCNDSERELLESAGWKTEPANIKAVDEVIRLKPPVKPKATVTVLDEAKPQTNKGDE